MTEVTEGAGAMTPSRFAALAEAYGGDVERWPSEHREAARALLRLDPLPARRVLAAARKLDLLLDQAVARAPATALRERILAAAPSRARPSGWRWKVGAGMGLAAACAAGLAAGDLTAPIALKRGQSIQQLERISDPAEEAAMLLGEPAEWGWV